jgi:hypothetical protein
LVTQVGLENQPKRPTVAIDEVEVGLDRVEDSLPVVMSFLDRPANAVDQLVGVALQQRQVELEFAGKVLVEHRLADSGMLGDVVHDGGVIPVVDEDIGRRREQLSPPLVPGHPHSAGRRARAGRYRLSHRSPLPWLIGLTLLAGIPVPPLDRRTDSAAAAW